MELGRRLRLLVALTLALTLALALAGCRRSAPPAPHVVAFVEDDYPAARARAKAEGKLVFVDAWATWCHTCLSLKQFVLSDPRLGTLEDRYVFASIDTERPGNAAFVERHPMRSWPTLFVLDPATDVARLAFAGSLPAEELVALLEDVKRGRAAGPLYQALADADAAAAAGKDADAARGYREVLRAAPTDFSRRARVVESLSLPLGKVDPGELVSVVLAEAPRLPRGNHLANALTAALTAAEELGEAERGDALMEHARALLADPSARLLDDDRSSLYEARVARLRRRGPEEATRREAEAWSRFLDARAEAAMSPASRAVFDAHRAQAYEAMGRLDKARALVEASERAFPDDYNHPARLARILRNQGELDAASAAADRALARAYGPRKLRVADLAASIERRRGDEARAGKLLDDALREIGDGPLPPGYEKLRARLKKEREAAAR
ncbi:MAG: thioredoxin family protein [Polyangiaceae bacterium]|nr:thioredoxin family protein [Polyangiaceae bacterium]